MKKKNLLIIGGISVIIFAIVGGILALKDDEKETNIYKVVFDSTGGTAVEEQKIEEGHTASIPSNPTKDGYTFAGWELDGKPYDFDTKVTKNITLKATWEKEDNKTESEENDKKEDETNTETEAVKKYTVTFDSNGGSKVSSQTVAEGSKVSKPSNPTRTGYTFKGWELDGKTYNFNTKVTKNITLKATWEKEDTETEKEPETAKKYTVTFDSNGGSKVSSQTVTEGSKATKPTNPTRSGYTFKGWELDGKTYDFNTKVTKNITLKATWEKENDEPAAKYTVTFDSNGGSKVSSQTVTEGSKATKPTNPTRSGYTFAGWELDGKTYDFNTKVTKDITLKAKWTQKKYTIKITAVDDYSPARILSVYENGTKITVSEIRYSDGTYLCSGANPNVNKNVIAGETTFIVVLNDGTRVTATVS